MNKSVDEFKGLKRYRVIFYNHLIETGVDGILFWAKNKNDLRTKIGEEGYALYAIKEIYVYVKKTELFKRLLTKFYTYRIRAKKVQNSLAKE